MTIFAVNSPMLDELKALNAEVSKRYYAVIVAMNYRGAIRIKRAAHAARRLTLGLVRQPLLGGAAPSSWKLPLTVQPCPNGMLGVSALHA